MNLFKNVALFIFLGALVISSFTFANDGEVEFDKNLNLIQLFQHRDYKLEISNNGKNLELRTLNISIKKDKPSGILPLNCEFKAKESYNGIILKSDAVVAGNFSSMHFQGITTNRSAEITAITLPLANKSNNNSLTDFKFTCRSTSGLQNFTFQELKQALEDKRLTIKIKPKATIRFLEISQKTVNEGNA